MKKTTVEFHRPPRLRGTIAVKINLGDVKDELDELDVINNIIKAIEENLLDSDHTLLLCGPSPFTSNILVQKIGSKSELFGPTGTIKTIGAWKELPRNTWGYTVVVSSEPVHSQNKLISGPLGLES